MAGHSKWHNIQHRKGRQDALRGKLFTKVAKEIILAAKSGGGDPANNVRLKNAISSAKAVNLPKDKIETAIKKGTGELAGGDLLEVVYEGYAPGGVALLIDVATDNKNRSVSDIRHIITKHGGTMGEAGCVAWMFTRSGYIEIEKNALTEEEILEKTIDFDVEDIEENDDSFTIFVPPSTFSNLKEALENENITIIEAKILLRPKNTVSITDVEIAQKCIKLIEMLEENEDVQSVASNFDISEDILAQLS